MRGQQHDQTWSKNESKHDVLMLLAESDALNSTLHSDCHLLQERGALCAHKVKHKN